MQLAAGSLSHPPECLRTLGQQARNAVPAASSLLRRALQRRRSVLGAHQAADQVRRQCQVQGPQRADHPLLHLQGRYRNGHSGKEKCAEILLTHGLSLDEVDIYGQTPMFYAISENKLEIVRKYATKGNPLPTQNASTTSINWSARLRSTTLPAEATWRCASCWSKREPMLNTWTIRTKLPLSTPNAQSFWILQSS